MSQTEAENRVLELMRELTLNDSTFKHLPEAIIDVLSILKTRGAEYNGDSSNIMEQVYDMGDMSAFIHTSRPIKRCKQILSNNGIHCTDAKILDKIIDTIGYALMWSCCRKQVKQEGYNG